MTDSMNPSNLIVISQNDLKILREKLDSLNIGNKITLTCNSLGGKYEEKVRVKSKTYHQGYTDEKFGSWGNMQNKFNKLPRYVIDMTPKRKQRVFICPLGSKIIDFRLGW